ncbi:MAG TPA: shikimate dehydrogenase, partial [Bacteroidales bacterium]|nr:shikimate dehydrogenase [Bacteroidales bacterium]
MGPFAVIGYPVSESMSPALFRAAYPQFPKD